MANNLPIKLSAALNLPQIGVPQNSINFDTITLQSQKFICVKDTSSDKPTLWIIDTSNPQNPTKRNISADNAMMHPSLPILALKAGQNLQFWNIANKEKLKSHNMDAAVEFWKFVNDETVAIVTSDKVYHWKFQSENAPSLKFNRDDSMNGARIINYRADNSGNWLCLVGIAKRGEEFVGCMQLYSVSRSKSQAIEGHAAAFCNYTAEGATSPSTLFTFARRSKTESKVFIIEVEHGNNAPAFQKKSINMSYPPEASYDFPVAMQASDRFGVAYVVTKSGICHLFDLISGVDIYHRQITDDTIFVTCPHPTSGGFLAIDRKGRVLLCGLDENNVVPFIMNNTNIPDNKRVAIQLAVRGDLPGADDIFVNQFNSLFSKQNYEDAAKLAADSPGQTLRNAKTIQLFQNLPAPSQGQPPIIMYFLTLLKKGKLNKIESVELVRTVINQNKVNLVEQWLRDDKLDCSEELGDMLQQAGQTTIASSVYYRGGCHAKVIGSLAATGQEGKIAEYCKKTGYTPDWNSLTQSLMQTNPEAAMKISSIATQMGGTAPSVDITGVVENLISRGQIQQASQMLLEHLTNRPDNAEAGPLQTRLLEINLMSAPTVAEAILKRDIFHHFDKVKIANLCERAQLYPYALLNYQNINDRKRVIGNPIDPEWLANEFFSTIDPEDALELLRQMLRVNPRQNLRSVITICTKFTKQLTPKACIELFESFRTNDGLFHYLASIVNDSEEKEVWNKYIEAAVRIGNMPELQRVVKDSDKYDPEYVKNFLKEAKLMDQLPLIIVCDRFDFVEDMISYLFKGDMLQHIEAYVTRVNPSNTPLVIGALIDVGCPEDKIKRLLQSVRGMCPVQQLVEQVEKRNKLKLILPWLESRIQEGNIDVELHNAVAKIVIDTNKDPQSFLETNNYYDTLTVGKYCEKRDPLLAYTAYKHGNNDEQLINHTSKCGLFKHQARYLVHKQDEKLWAKVLDPENSYRRQLIDQVVQTALPETQDSKEVYTTVKAFFDANMPQELIELLEKIVIGNKNKELSENGSLQNLLLITAIKVPKQGEENKVMEYVNKLQKYNAPDVSSEAIEHGLYEEAFAMLKKFDHEEMAMDVLIKHVKDLDRASDYAARVRKPEVYTKLAAAQLEGGKIKEAIAAYLKADDASNYAQVISIAGPADCWDDLTKFLEMCNKKAKEPKIESELCFAYAKVGKLGELEEFITNPGCTANTLEVGERCYNEGLYEAAKRLFTVTSNHGKLAQALVRLGDFKGAVDAASQAKNIRTWKEVNLACVQAGEWRLAQIAGLNVVVEPDELEEIVNVYEKGGHFSELIQLLNAAIQNNENTSNTSLFTELAGAYSKYEPEKLMDYLQKQHGRITIQKAIFFCQNNHQWPELKFLYIKDGEPDNAAFTVMEHPNAWDHSEFLKDIISKVNNHDICYKAIQFYIEQHPSLVNQLLSSVLDKIDHARVVSLLKKLNHLPLVKPYLQSIQSENLAVVNEALNNLYVEEDDYDSLRSSIDQYAEFDHLTLAQKLEKHEMLEFRRISASIYKNAKRYDSSIDISKKDKMYKDAIQTAAESKSPELVEELLRFFVAEGQKECFSAALYTCYDSVKPDIALELAWRNNIIEFAFPFLIQATREYTEKVDVLWNEKLAKEKKEKKEEAGPSSDFNDPSSFMGQPQIGYYPDPNMGVPPNMYMGGQQW